MITLLLLPGMDGTGELFEPFVAALRGEFKVVVMRYPAQSQLAYNDLESRARAAIPAEGPYAILGESFSGPIAMSLAAGASPRLKGLILCCSFACNPRPGLYGLRSLVHWLPIAGAPLGLVSQLLLGRFSTPALRSMLVKSVKQLPAPTLRARLRAVLEVDVTDKLPMISAPVLYLRATRDRLVPPAAAMLVARLRPGTTITDLESPHFLLQSVPSEAAAAVRAFLRKTA